MDFNYWYDSGPTSATCTTNHLVIMSDKMLYEHEMEENADVSKGYANSTMRVSGLNDAKNIINNAFDSNHILNHKEYLVSNAAGGVPSISAWFDSTVEIPSEIMVYGHYENSVIGDNLSSSQRSSSNSQQLSAMRSPILNRVWGRDIWLRDIANEVSFSCIDINGNPSIGIATYRFGVRPVFGLCKRNR